MKAAVLNSPQTPLSIEELTLDKPGPTEAIIRVIAAGVCHSDLHFIEGTYPTRHPAV
jgi:S-(hydroxymethyl)glutathione dehydrogenase/alcohol dehydrogenase